MAASEKQVHFGKMELKESSSGETVPVSLFLTLVSAQQAVRAAQQVLHSDSAIVCA